MPLSLTSVYLSRNNYGVNKGSLEGNLTVSGVSGDIKLKMSEEQCQRIVELCAEQLVENTKAIAESMTSEIMTSVPALENKGE